MSERPTFSPELFRNRHVLITGAASGIGAAIADAFLAHGAEVTGTASGPDRARELSTRGIAPIICDVRQDDDVAALFTGLSRLDVLVCAAGIACRQDEYQWPVFRDVIETNLFGTARFALSARDLLAQSQGSVITIASMLSTFGDRLVPSYAASKGGVAQLTKSLAIEYAEQGIRVNAIAPGWIHTAMTDDLVQNPDQGPRIAARTALNRWGQAHEVAQGALFLASPAASYVTGTMLTIDGGYSIT